MMFKSRDFASRDPISAAEIANRRVSAFVERVKSFLRLSQETSSCMARSATTDYLMDLQNLERARKELLAFLDNGKEFTAEKRYCFRRDEDSHVYLVPLELAESFDTECELAYSEDEYETFEEKFGQYRIGAGPYNYSFIDPQRR